MSEPSPMTQEMIEAARRVRLTGIEQLRLRVLVDRSAVEVFANDRKALLRRVYASGESVHVKLFSRSGAAHILSLSCWEKMPSNPC